MYIEIDIELGVSQICLWLCGSLLEALRPWQKCSMSGSSWDFSLLQSFELFTSLLTLGEEARDTLLEWRWLARGRTKWTCCTLCVSLLQMYIKITAIGEVAVKMLLYYRCHKLFMKSCSTIAFRMTCTTRSTVSTADISQINSGCTKHYE